MGHSEMSITIKQTKMRLHSKVFLTLQHLYNIQSVAFIASKAHMDSAPTELHRILNRFSQNLNTHHSCIHFEILKLI